MNNQKGYLEKSTELLKSYLKFEIDNYNKLKVGGEKLKRENENLKRENERLKRKNERLIGLTYDEDDDWLRKRHINLVERFYNLRIENEKLNSEITQLIFENVQKESLESLELLNKCEKCEKIEENSEKKPKFFEFWLKNFDKEKDREKERRRKGGRRKGGRRKGGRRKEKEKENLDFLKFY